MMIDFDQSGTYRSFVPKHLGPSIGWTMIPATSVFPITSAGTYALSPDVSQVPVSVAGAVTIILPRATFPSVPAIGQPALYGGIPITILDVGPHAAAHPITINPAPGENIMGLTSIQISADFGAFTLTPSPSTHSWNAILP